MNRLYQVIIYGLVATGAYGAQPMLSPPRGGDVTLGCWGYTGHNAWLEKPRPHLNNGDGTRYFLTDIHSEGTEEHPDGSIDVGIDGENFQLFANRGATLTRGGRFQSDFPSAAILAVMPSRIAFVRDAHQDEESTLVLRTEFLLVHDGYQLKFPGVILCQVYDFKSFFKNVCPNTKIKVGELCR